MNPPGHWHLGTAFIAAVRGGTDAAQFSRFRKLYTEPFYVLEMGRADATAAARLVLSGATPNSRYRLAVLRDGRVTCSCMDASLNCARLGVACKHACFAVVRVFRVGETATRHFLMAEPRQQQQRLRLRPEDVDVLEARVLLEGDGLPAASGVDAPSASGSYSRVDGIDALCRSFERASVARRPALDFLTLKRPPGHDDDCPVCYAPLLLLVDGESQLRGCPDCGNAVHLGCVRRWLRHAARPSCVMCRSTSWAHFVD